jgi:hypothetical protein
VVILWVSSIPNALDLLSVSRIRIGPEEDMNRQKTSLLMLGSPPERGDIPE